MSRFSSSAVKEWEALFLLLTWERQCRPPHIASKLRPWTSTLRSFHHIVGGWWKSRFLDENRLRPILITICMWPESIFYVFCMFFAVAYGFSWFCFVFFGFSTVSFFHHIVGEWWNSCVLDENRLRPIFVTIWHVARIDFLCFLNVFRSCLWFSMVCLVFLVFQPSHFFITSLEDDENLVSLMKTASSATQ